MLSLGASPVSLGEAQPKDYASYGCAGVTNR